MTQIICVGDIHVMDRPPVNATESYTDDIIEMLTWIANHAHETGVKTVVWAGDIFHHKQPSRTSHALVLRMIAVVKAYLALDIELIIVTGNHDISNDVLASVHEKQPLGVLLEAGAHELEGWHHTLPLYGVPWQQRWLHDGVAMDAFESWREDTARLQTDKSKCLAVTHAPIYPPSVADNILFDLLPLAGHHGLSEAMGNEGSLYYGHIHEDHGVFEVEGVTYANMGAISRGSLHEYNVTRTIKVALWEDGTFTEIPVPHKPASEVFKIAQAEKVKAEKLSLDKFLSEVGSTSLDITSTGSVIAHINERPEIPAPVKAKAIQILEKVE